MSPKIEADDLVDAQTVADVLGLSHRNTVSQYQRRYADMPRPVINLGVAVSSFGSDQRSSVGRLTRLQTAELAVSAIRVRDARKAVGRPIVRLVVRLGLKVLIAD